MSAIASLRRRLAEANPMLIKDLRQALRGRLFRGAFLLTLLVATIVAASVLASVNEWNRNDSGTNLFTALLVAYVLISFVVLPVLANRSMAAEREPLLLDALALTGLEPTRIVAGKYRSSQILALLILCAFLPGFAAAAGLYGLELGLAAAILLATGVVGASLNVLGIWAACIARGPVAGNLMLGGLLMVLGGCCALWLSWIMLQFFEVFRASPSWSARALTSLASAALLAGGIAAWLRALCAWLLSHPEHPDVARPRRAVIALTAIGAVIAFFAILQSGWSETKHVCATLLYFFITALMLPHLVENDALGRRAEIELRAGARRSLLMLPGGGGAVLLWLLLLLCVSPLQLLEQASVAAPDHASLAGLPFAALLECLALGGLLPSLAGRSRGPRARWLLLCALALPMLALVHALVALMAGAPESSAFWSLNPFGLLAQAGVAPVLPDVAADFRTPYAGLALWSLLALFGLATALLRAGRARQRAAEARRAPAPLAA